MSQADQDDSSTDSPGGSHFTSENAAENGSKAWRSKREQILKDHDLWDTYKSVPPLSERDAPFESYLPGGVNYEDSSHE